MSPAPVPMLNFMRVDERIVDAASSLDFGRCPPTALTSITAGEMLFDAFRLTRGRQVARRLLRHRGAEGVGSILIQPRQGVGLGSRYCHCLAARKRRMGAQDGADTVVDHRGDLACRSG